MGIVNAGLTVAGIHTFQDVQSIPTQVWQLLFGG